MAKGRTLLFLIGFFVVNWINSYAQKDNQDSLLAQSAIHMTENYFNKAIGQQSWLYNGPSYVAYYPNVEGTAYFQDITTFSNGTVWYEGFRFENVPLKYDVYKDLMVTKLYDNSSSLSLKSEKVSDVYLNDHHFVYLEIDQSDVTVNLKSGFYDLIYDGKTKFYVRNAKTMHELAETVLRRYFSSKTSYFLLKDGVYYQLSSESSIMNILKDQKTNLKKYLKDNRIKFRANPERAMALLASYYDTLTK